MRRSLVTLSIIALIVFACDGSSGGATSAPRPRPTPTVEPRPSAALTIEQILANLDHTKIETLSKDKLTSSILDWPTFESGSLTIPQQNRLCSALNTQGADEVFAGIGAVALNFISLKLGRKAVSKDFEGALKIAVGVAFKACPLWQPLLIPEPPPRWYPDGYQLVIGDPTVAWDWADTGTCPDQYAGCWWMNVVARDGCPTSLSASILAHDPDDIAIERVGPVVSAPVAAGDTIKFRFFAARRDLTASAEYIDCR